MHKREPITLNELSSDCNALLRAMLSELDRRIATIGGIALKSH